MPLFAGFAVSKGELTMVGIVIAGVLGNLVGSLIGYAIGYFGRVDLLERHRIFHVSPERMGQIEGWFERNGSATVFFSRMLPLVRSGPAPRVICGSSPWDDPAPQR